MSEYFREPKKIRTRTELVKSCRMLRERNLALSQALKRIRELPFRITDDEPSRIRMEALIEQAIKGEIE